MLLSLSKAAKETGVSKSVISRAISSGRLSATRQEDGSFAIDPIELFRVYPPASTRNRSEEPVKEQNATVEILGENRELKARIELLGEERERERQQLHATIDDLRGRLDKETDERRRLTLLLTHEPANQNMEPKPAPQRAPTVRLWLWLGLAFVAGGAVIYYGLRYLHGGP